MKINRKSLLPFLLIAALLSTLVVHGDPLPSKPEMRGMWVATVLNIDYPAKPTTNADVLRTEALNILDRAQSLGLNAVFLQVRPAGDALYASQYFPWSKYLTGTQGTAPAGGFDPLAFWVEEAHKRGIELHAWVNPYRITRKTAAEPTQELSQLAPNHPARLHPEWTVKHTDGNFYFNPGLPEVRQLLIDSCLELITRYGVDGIHFDDYFYPGKDFNDASTYAQYGKGYADIGAWRRENVNILVRDLHGAIKAVSPSTRFGISPFGIWANRSSNPLGSDTRGAQSYYDHYADSQAWIKAGTIDYITPQLYWHIGFEIADYSKLLTWWKNAVAGSSVDLYIGHGAYRAGNTDSASPWFGTAEISRQLQLNRQTPEVKGSIFYNHKALAGNSALGDVIRQWSAAGSAVTATVNPVVPLTGSGIAAAVSFSNSLAVSRPSSDITTSLTAYYLNGVSDPSQPLTLNGEPVLNRSSQGFFGVLVPLSPGKNTFVLNQGSTTVVRTITRGGGGGSGAAATMGAFEIPADSAFPQASEYLTPGSTITLSCRAPIGSTVTVTLGGNTYTMTPASTKAPGAGLYPTTYTYKLTLPTYTGQPRVVELGTPSYRAVYKGAVRTRKAAAPVGVIMNNAPLLAIASDAVVNTYSTATTSNGASGELYSGMVDRVTTMTGKFVQLSSGSWVSRSAVRTYAATEPVYPVIKSAEYTVGEKWDALRLDMAAPLASVVNMEGNTLKLSIAMAGNGPIPALPSKGLLSAAIINTTDKGAEYILTLKPGQRIDGFFLSRTQTGIMVTLKRPVKAAVGDQPLKGITVMLDPGHGGSDNGAIGPLGTAYAEKHINLDNALALQAALVQKGATVMMTRSTDVEVSLDQRLSMSRQAKPDLFISLHANSMDNNVDISKIAGFSAFYRDTFAQAFTQQLHDAVVQQMQRGSKGVHGRNFYVTRGTWAPSILLEAGFVPNPGEFQLMMDRNEQNRMAAVLTQTIINYFSR